MHFSFICPKENALNRSLHLYRKKLKIERRETCTDTIRNQNIIHKEMRNNFLVIWKIIGANV